MQNIGISSSTHLTERKSSVISSAATASVQPLASEQKPRSLWERIKYFLADLFSRKHLSAGTDQRGMTFAQRTAAARAAQMPAPMAFRSDSTNTLVTPSGAYAGKPVMQAIRKRAEQQFQEMDVTQSTMN